MTSGEHKEFCKLALKMHKWCQEKTDEYCEDKCRYAKGRLGCILRIPSERLDYYSIQELLEEDT